MKLYLILLEMSLIALGVIPGVSEDANLLASPTNGNIYPQTIQNGPLQGAIDAVGSGGTIQLKEGIYRQTVNIDRSVNIIGAGPGKTFVNGDKIGSVFTIGKTKPNIDVKLSGMTIQGGVLAGTVEASIILAGWL